MHPESEPQRMTLTGVAAVAIALALIGYLSVAAVRGEHGLFSLFRVEAQEARLRAELTQIQQARAVVANRVERLSDDNLDLDMLDERARRVLGLARPDELLIH